MLLLMTGASGVGKSSARAAIAPKLLPAVTSVELADLSPVPPDAMTRAWRQQAAELAVRRAAALSRSGSHLLLAGDPVPALEILAAPSAPQLDAIAVCLLDADPATQAARLAARGDDLTLLHDHQAFAEWMRRQARDPRYEQHVVTEGSWDEMRWDRLRALPEDWGIHVIDTSPLSRKQVADATLAWSRQAIAGEAPAFSVPNL